MLNIKYINITCILSKMIDIPTIQRHSISLNIKQQLIYDLLFDESKTIYYINLNDYCNYTNRSKFKDEIRKILKLGKVEILDDRIIHDNDIVYWKLTIKHLCHG